MNRFFALELNPRLSGGDRLRWGVSMFYNCMGDYCDGLSNL